MADITPSFPSRQVLQQFGVQCLGFKWDFAHSSYMHIIPIVRITFTMHGGLARSGAFYFEVLEPVAESFSPSSGTIGVPFVINGSGFGTYYGTSTRVKINGVAMPISTWIDTQIKGTVPGIAQSGSYDLVVERATSDGGLAQSAAIAFGVVSPQLAGISPTSSQVGTITYTLNGTGFGSYNGANTVVLIGGTSGEADKPGCRHGV